MQSLSLGAAEQTNNIKMTPEAIAHKAKPSQADTADRAKPCLGGLSEQHLLTLMPGTAGTHRTRVIVWGLPTSTGCDHSMTCPLPRGQLWTWSLLCGCRPTLCEHKLAPAGRQCPQERHTLPETAHNDPELALAYGLVQLRVRN